MSLVARLAGLFRRRRPDFPAALSRALREACPVGVRVGTLLAPPDVSPDSNPNRS